MDKQLEAATTVHVISDEFNTSQNEMVEMHSTFEDVKDMVRMGKEQQFKRTFSFVSIFGFAMILMSTWEAYLGTVAFGLGNGGTAGMLYVYIAVSVLFFIVVLSMSEMASMAPTAGGQYHWVSEFAPRQWQKQLSYFVGWLCVLGWQAGCAIGCFLGGSVVQGLVVLNNEAYEPKRWHGTLIAIAILLLVAIFNIFLARFLPQIEILILVLHLVGFFAVMIPLWILAPKNTSHDVWTKFENAGEWRSTGLACLVGMISPIASLLGADAAVHMSEELRDASKTVPRAMAATAAFNGVLGLVTVITFCYSVGDVETVLATRTGYPFIQVFYDSTQSYAGATVMASIMVVLAIANGLTNMAGASRQLFAFARDRGVPFHAWFATVPANWNIPLNSIVFTALFSSLLTVINIGSFIAFNQIVSLGLCALLTSYLVSIGCVTLRRLRSQPLLPSRFSLGRWGLTVNLVSIAFLALALVLSFFPPAAKPVRETMNYAVVVYTGVMMIAGVYYAFWGRYTYVGPVEYVRKSA